LAWTYELGAGTLESIPLVYRGVMYVVSPGNGAVALDAASGAAVWSCDMW
jgi:glucose dehydrogenase